MKKNMFIIALFLISVSFVNATVWRLNNAPGTDADFTTLQAAHDSPLVLNGDTLYLEASSGSYGNLVATKKLIIIGAGYFLAENLNNQAIITSSVVSDITFNNGSQGSKICGCQIQKIEINTSNVSIERNYITRNTNSNYLVRVNSDNINNLLIKNNYLHYNAAYHSFAYCIYTNKNGINNVTILNNYIYTPYFHSDKAAIDLGSGFSGLIQNNIVYGNIRVNNSIFYNNILIDGVFTPSNTSVLHNISNGTQFGTDNGNQSNVNMANVFIGTGSTDGQWQLKEGSPAIGAGLGGIDCGMFGGTDPYILSGIPAIPAIYKFDMEVDNVEQKIDVEVSVKSRN
jgi:hypothetical protein